VPPFALADGDSVVADSVPPLRASLFVYVAGMVHPPGRFPWRSGMTLRVPVTLAGGVRVGADLREAEVARMPVERSGGQLAEAIRVPLDSSYLMERDSLERYPGPAGPTFRPLEVRPRWC
jgi:protein involved in polysaccharide export with SLBB domain